jgi:hypothetical protein
MNDAEKLAAIAAILGGNTPATPDDWRTETGFPKVKTIAGVRILLQEPINWQWLPSTAAQMYGGQGTAGGNPDPSNGDGSTAFPRRTYWGWPIHYAANMDGSLTGKGVVVHGDASIDPPTDVAVEAYLAALLVQHANQVQSQADLNARPKP